MFNNIFWITIKLNSLYVIYYILRNISLIDSGWTKILKHIVKNLITCQVCRQHCGFVLCNYLQTLVNSVKTSIMFKTSFCAFMRESCQRWRILNWPNCWAHLVCNSLRKIADVFGVSRRTVSKKTGELHVAIISVDGIACLVTETV